MQRAEAGSRPGGRPSFLARARKEGKRNTPLLAATPALRCGATCVGTFAGCAAELAARLRRSAQTTAASQFTKHARAGAHATPQSPRRRRFQKGWEPTRAIAALGLARGRAQRWPVSSLPFWQCREAQGAGWRVCRRTHPLRDLACRVCPNGAPQARSELRGTPRERASQVARSEAEGHGQQGRPFFGDFLSAKRKKVTAPPGAHPGLRPQQRNRHQKDS